MQKCLMDSRKGELKLKYIWGMSYESKIVAAPILNGGINDVYFIFLRMIKNYFNDTQKGDCLHDLWVHTYWWDIRT